MLSFFKLIRLPNLFIIALTQYAMRWGVVYPMLKFVNIKLSALYPTLIAQNSLHLQVSEFDFFLIVLSTIMIAAAGYIINDYFDVKLDRINKPEEVVIDKKIKRRHAMAAHTIINVFALAIAFYVFHKLGIWKLTVIYLICAGGLWFYSTTFKRQLIIGNVLIALFTAFVPLLVGIVEVSLINREYAVLNNDFGVSFNKISYFILGFSFFAFFSTLIREIIKDAEDLEGDAAYSCNTIPIAWGLKITKFIISALILFVIFTIAYVQYSQYQIGGAEFSIAYFFIFLQLPLIFLLYKVLKALEPKDFTFPSKLNKVIMLFGILYTIVIYYSFLVV